MPNLSPQEFVSRWRGVELTERSASQQHFLDLCSLVGHKTPVEADPRGDWFTFEIHILTKKSMPRKPTSPHPRWRNPLGLGSLYVRQAGAGLWLWTSVGSKRESTGIRWPEIKKDQTKAHTEGMKLLAERVLLFKHPELRVVPPSPTPASRSLYDVTATFLENRLPKLSPGMQVRFKACGQHLFMNGPDGDVPLEYDALVDFMQARINESNLKPSYMQKLLQVAAHFTDHWVERGWLSKSPIPALHVEKVVSESEDQRIWEHAEVQRIIKYFDTCSMPLFSLAVRFLYRTGMRVEELCKLRWEDFSDTDFMIHGKRTSQISAEQRAAERGWQRHPERRGGKIRYFPLVDSKKREWMPGLRSILCELRAFDERQDGWVFPWRHPTKVQSPFKICREALKLDDGRKLHNFRASALWYYRNILRIQDTRLLDAILGNSEAVRKKHYDRRLVVNEMSDQLVTEVVGLPVDLPF